jgi:hypothetical protein
VEVVAMSDFTAPLFVGDPFLTQCLNGQAVMGDRPTDQAPHDSVVRVQTALQTLGFDLGPAGVDGQWGQATYDAALAFKTALDIRTPQGVLDGYVGERTMTALEAIFGMAPFDAASVAVIDLGARVGDQIDRGSGVVTVEYENGIVASVDVFAAWPIPTPLSDAWLAAGGPSGPGAPSADPFMLLGSVAAQYFRESALVATTGGEAAEVPLKALYELESGASGVPVGLPAPFVAGSDVVGLPGTQGAVVWGPHAPAIALPQTVVDHWVTEEQAGRPLGAPASRAISDDAGLVFAFSLGGLLLDAAGAVTVSTPHSSNSTVIGCSRISASISRRQLMGATFTSWSVDPTSLRPSPRISCG